MSMAFSFKFPKIGGGGDATLSSPMTVAADIPSSGRSLTSKLPLPGFLAGQPVVQQMKALGGIFLAVMLLIAGLVFHDNRESTHNTAYIAASGDRKSTRLNSSHITISYAV